MKYTKIHNKHYDLTNFDHPGGVTPISQAYGRDATVMFESHHPFVDKSKLDALLKKYEINKLPDGIELLPGEEDVPKFDFDSDFAIELKQEVRKYFEEESKRRGVTLIQATKARHSHLLYIGFFFILRLIVNIMWLKGWWLSLILMPICDWVSGSSIFHDALHFAMFYNEYVNLSMGYLAGLMLTSPQHWRYQHNIGHHCYPNMIDRDPDLYVPLTRYRIELKKEVVPPSAQISIISLMAWTKNIFIIPIVELTNRVSLNILESVLPSWNNKAFLFDRLMFIVIYIMLPFCLFETWKGLIFAFVPRILFSMIFFLITQVTHIHTPCMIDDKNWHKHQIETATNYGCDNLINYIISGGLNYQIEHHLFPNVCHCHHKNIRPIVMRLCKKHNIQYKEFNSYIDAFNGYYDHITRMYELKE